MYIAWCVIKRSFSRIQKRSECYSQPSYIYLSRSLTAVQRKRIFCVESISFKVCVRERRSFYNHRKISCRYTCTTFFVLERRRRIIFLSNVYIRKKKIIIGASIEAVIIRAEFHGMELNGFEEQTICGGQYGLIAHKVSTCARVLAAVRYETQKTLRFASFTFRFHTFLARAFFFLSIYLSYILFDFLSHSSLCISLNQKLFALDATFTSQSH